MILISRVGIDHPGYYTITIACKTLNIIVCYAQCFISTYNWAANKVPSWMDLIAPEYISIYIVKNLDVLVKLNCDIIHIHKLIPQKFDHLYHVII